MESVKDKEVSSFMKLGFSKCQAIQLFWAVFFEEQASVMEYKNQVRFLSQIKFDCFCFDCNEGGQFIPSTAREFIIRHKNHNTKTIKLK